MMLRLKKRGEKALEKALVSVNAEDEGDLGGVGGSGNGSSGSGTSGKRWKGYPGPGEETIPEGEEPPPTPGLTVQKVVSQGQGTRGGRRDGRREGERERSNSRLSESSRSSWQHRRESAETGSVEG